MIVENFEEEELEIVIKLRKDVQNMHEIAGDLAFCNDKYRHALQEIEEYTQDGMSRFKWEQVNLLATKALES